MGGENTCYVLLYFVLISNLVNYLGFNNSVVLLLQPRRTNHDQQVCGSTLNDSMFVFLNLDKKCIDVCIINSVHLFCSQEEVIKVTRYV